MLGKKAQTPPRVYIPCDVISVIPPIHPVRACRQGSRTYEDEGGATGQGTGKTKVRLELFHRVDRTHDGTVKSFDTSA